MQLFAVFITKIIDFFYKIFVSRIPTLQKVVTPELFRYASCGGGNMLLDWILYFVLYNFVVGHEVVYYQLLFTQHTIAISPHIAAFCICFPITLLTGFWLNRNITFTQSTLRGRKQLCRYVLIVLINLLVNYVGLKFFVDLCGLYPTPSKIIVTLITVVISYFGQKYYSFRK